MDLNTGIRRISRALAPIPWTTWHPPRPEFLERPSFKDMGEIPTRYPPSAFITLMAMAGLNDYQTIGRAESGYWPRFWRHVKGNEAPGTPVQMADMLKPFYSDERLYPAKVNRLYRFLSSSLANSMWNMQPEQAAEDLPNLWRLIAVTMGQKCEAKTIAFAPRTIGTALRILGVDSFNYEGIPIPVDSRLHSLTPNLLEDETVRTFWEYVLLNIQKTEPRVLMYHLDAFLWPYAGAGDKMVWLMSQGIDEATSKEIVCAFEEITNVRVL